MLYTSFMKTKAYFANLHPAWPIERQREILGEADATYTDKLGPTALKRRDPADLKDRANLLRPTSRRAPETIRVASPVTFAFSRADFAMAVAAAHARMATLVFVAPGLTLPPAPEVETYDKLLASFDKQNRTRGLVMTRAERAALLIADTQRRAQIIKPYWHLPEEEWPKAKLLMMAGPRPGVPMSPANAKRELGSRHLAQAEYQRHLNREAGRAAARAKKKGTPNG